MRVIITDFAKQEIRRTASYIQKEFGKISKNNFLQSIRLTRKLIGTNPYLGPKEQSLDELPGNYRSIVVNNLNKIVYSIKEDHILIEDLWDVRREPNSLKRQINP
ncbi:MAG: type II toxin-antitoxin system RelE/ParE family toxin [Bacteroidales bacterium]|nr:type II toxin-antitoxin system RelE/ParE family toxin [Bacteroidales bacterium]